MKEELHTTVYHTWVREVLSREYIIVVVSIVIKRDLGRLQRSLLFARQCVQGPDSRRDVCQEEQRRHIGFAFFAAHNGQVLWLCFALSSTPAQGH